MAADDPLSGGVSPLDIIEEARKAVSDLDAEGDVRSGTPAAGPRAAGQVSPSAQPAARPRVQKNNPRLLKEEAKRKAAEERRRREQLVESFAAGDAQKGGGKPSSAARIAARRAHAKAAARSAEGFEADAAGQAAVQGAAGRAVGSASNAGSSHNASADQSAEAKKGDRPSIAGNGKRQRRAGKPGTPQAPAPGAGDAAGEGPVKSAVGQTAEKSPASKAPANEPPAGKAAASKSAAGTAPAGKAPASKSAAGKAAVSKPSDKAAAGRGSAAGAAAKRAKMGTKGKVVCIVAAVIAVLVVAALVAFSIFRWAVGNDAQDIQGTWYVAGTDVPVEITQDAIKLNDEVSYAYVVDAGAKTVAFSFGDLNGSGHYRFSLDRQQLAIMDGSFNGVDTFFGDLGWMPGALVQAAQGTQASPAGAADVTLLSRTPASA